MITNSPNFKTVLDKIIEKTKPKRVFDVDRALTDIANYKNLLETTLKGVKNA